jgi:hypothetical protein
MRRLRVHAISWVAGMQGDAQIFNVSLFISDVCL